MSLQVLPSSDRFGLCSSLSASEALCKPVRQRCLGFTRRGYPLSQPRAAPLLAAARQNPCFPACSEDDKLVVGVDLGKFEPSRGSTHVGYEQTIELQFLQYEDWSLRVHTNSVDAEFMYNTLNLRLQETRPTTHQTIVNLIEKLDAKVLYGCVHDIKGSVYHAKLHIATPLWATSSLDLDCRPTDCINVCLRAKVPMYVRGKLAQQYATYSPQPVISVWKQRSIQQSCLAEERRHDDPFLLARLQLQLYISANQFELAERIRTQMNEDMINFRHCKPKSDRMVYILVVAMRAALEDGRWEEAASIRDALKAIRTGKMPKPVPRPLE